MQHHPRFVLLYLFALGAAVAPAAARAESVPSAVAPTSAPNAGPVYVGVELLPVDAPTRALFKVPEAAGLFVIGVAPGSPADGKLAQGDILLRLGDQLLVNREQLRTLVRTRRSGDAAEFTVLRGGREEAVTLTLKPAPVAAPVTPVPGGMPGFEDAESLLRRLNERVAPVARRATLSDRVTLGGGVSVMSTRTRVTGDGSVSLTEADGRKRIVVKDPAGKVLVEGELTDELRERTPEWARELIDAKAPAAGLSAPVAEVSRPAHPART